MKRPCDGTDHREEVLIFLAPPLSLRHGNGISFVLHLEVLRD
jgi:hypothetical protein